MLKGMLKNVVGSIAPSLGSAVGGPLGGMATKIICETLGCKADAKSIESAINNVNCDNIILTGDFNDNQFNINSKMKHICTKYSLRQLIDEPTNFTESSSSLIDLIITNDPFVCTLCWGWTPNP